jgi:hypothetical protein
MDRQKALKLLKEVERNGNADYNEAAAGFNFDTFLKVTEEAANQKWINEEIYETAADIGRFCENEDALVRVSGCAATMVGCFMTGAKHKETGLFSDTRQASAVFKAIENHANATLRNGKYITAQGYCKNLYDKAIGDILRNGWINKRVFDTVADVDRFVTDGVKAFTVIGCASTLLMRFIQYGNGKSADDGALCREPRQAGALAIEITRHNNANRYEDAGFYFKNLLAEILSEAKERNWVKEQALEVIAKSIEEYEYRQGRVLVLINNPALQLVKELDKYKG